MADILGITPPPEPQDPDTLSPDVTRDIQRDAVQVALHDTWFHGVLSATFWAATLVMLWLDSTRPLRLSAQIRPALPIQFAAFGVLSLFAAISAWRAYRRMRAADAAHGFDGDDAMAPGRNWQKWPEPRSWVFRRSRTVILVLLLLAFGYQFVTRIRPVTGPVVFVNATIRINTGAAEEDMTVAVANGRIAFVGKSGDALPPALANARQLDAGRSVVLAATFDHSAAAPLDGLRHIWVGQLYEGAPGDVVIAPYINARFSRGRMGDRMPDATDLLGAVVNDRYYSRQDLLKKR
jgi:hypothetical protein